MLRSQSCSVSASEIKVRAEDQTAPSPQPHHLMQGRAQSRGRAARPLPWAPLRRGPHCNASPGPGHLNLSNLKPSNLPVLRTLQRSALQGATASSRQEGSKALARACRDCRSVSCDGVLFPLPPFPLKMFKGAKACFSRLC